jgi:hypothetical protein
MRSSSPASNPTEGRHGHAYEVGTKETVECYPVSLIGGLSKDRLQARAGFVILKGQLVHLGSLSEAPPVSRPALLCS